MGNPARTTRKPYPSDRLGAPMAEGSLERTLVLIKPDGVRRGLVGEILARFERKGLKILAAKSLHVTPELAARHYAEHHGKPFYPALMQHITSGPILGAASGGDGRRGRAGHRRTGGALRARGRGRRSDGRRRRGPYGRAGRFGARSGPRCEHRAALREQP